MNMIVVRSFRLQKGVKTVGKASKALFTTSISEAASTLESASKVVSHSGENKIDLRGVEINYIKVGSGPHHLLLTPGALGSIWTDFEPQIAHLNKQKFTVVAWDPPGYGRSVPPKRDFSPGFHFRDADLALKLMKELGIERYSVLGWDDGGTSSMIIAAKRPEVVEKLVVWGSHSYITGAEVETLRVFRNHTLIPPRLRAPYIAAYGEEYYDELWKQWTDATINIYNNETKGDICSSLVPKISCPTLILSGWKDFNISMEHHHFLSKKIENARYYIFEEGKHYFHLQFWKEFNRIVENFLLEK